MIEPICFGRDVCRNLDIALHREWLETNGMGGYASSTIVGVNTRRYHGLLMAAIEPPTGRMLLLSKLEETLVRGDQRYELAANCYTGAVHPEGFRFLREFRQESCAKFVYDAGGIEIAKSVWMVQGENTVVIRYEIGSDSLALSGCWLELRPLIAFRDFHATTHENGALDQKYEAAPGVVRMQPYAGLPPLYLHHSGADVQPSGFWYRSFEFDRERERGLDYREDLFQPCVLRFDLERGSQVWVAASTQARAPGAELSMPAKQDPIQRAASQFFVRRGERASIIAGYHWFGDWGRDTMISLPGLALATGRNEIAHSILANFASFADRGMLPNRFPDAGGIPEYNTVDAALWFFEAVRALVAATGDYDFIRREIYPVMADMIGWYQRGTRFHIHADSDGLLYAGEPGVQLTWMDVKIGEWVVTPRTGKAVEIQALWYHALCTIAELAEYFAYSADGGRFRAAAALARENFEPLFWNAGQGCLYDVIDGETRDASIRPNQIFAVSLFHRMLGPGQEKCVVDTVAARLLTPYGLRTLDPADPRYRGRYEGDPEARDSAYHQGTVWPWLMGPFLTAWRRVYGREDPHLLDALHSYMANEGMGRLPELFDGDAPHRAAGCISQAWSVAELLRVSRE